MIISASRRTDIPAFHSEWMMNRLRSGYVLTRNPVCRDVIYKINLDPKRVDMLVFMSKDPRPIVRYLDEISDMGMRYCFQITINPYGKDLEPNVPHVVNILDSFKEISDKIGKESMTWRYDPVIINGRYDVEYHRSKFDLLCEELQGYTERCIFGTVDIHKKLEGLRDGGTIGEISSSTVDEIGEMMSDSVKERGMQLNYCCADVDLSRYGITSKGCVDKDYMARLGVPSEISPPLRDRCKCVKMVDIGHYDTCHHDCVYCYANMANNEIRKKRSYDPNGEMLYGKPGKDDKITELSYRQISRITDF